MGEKSNQEKQGNINHQHRSIESIPLSNQDKTHPNLVNSYVCAQPHSSTFSPTESCKRTRMLRVQHVHVHFQHEDTKKTLLSLSFKGKEKKFSSPHCSKQGPALHQL